MKVWTDLLSPSLSRDILGAWLGLYRLLVPPCYVLGLASRAVSCKHPRFCPGLRLGTTRDGASCVVGKLALSLFTFQAPRDVQMSGTGAGVDISVDYLLCVNDLLCQRSRGDLEWHGNKNRWVARHISAVCSDLAFCLSFPAIEMETRSGIAFCGFIPSRAERDVFGRVGIGIREAIVQCVGDIKPTGCTLGSVTRGLGARTDVDSLGTTTFQAQCGGYFHSTAPWIDRSRDILLLHTSDFQPMSVR